MVIACRAIALAVSRGTPQWTIQPIHSLSRSPFISANWAESETACGVTASSCGKLDTKMPPLDRGCWNRSASAEVFQAIGRVLFCALTTSTGTSYRDFLHFVG